MKKIFIPATLLILISTLSFGQTSNLEEVRKIDLQEKAISSDSSYLYMLSKTSIKSNLGNFIKNDTVYYPNKKILRTSESSKGFLNGYLIYYNSNGGIYLKSKYKNGEHTDTSFYYNMNGSLAMMQAYFEGGRTSVYDYYNSGEVKKISKLKIVDLTPEELKNSTSKYKQKAVTEGEQYFDKNGKEISFGEQLEILSADSQNATNSSTSKKSNEVDPSFPGGEKAMIKFLQENLVYPQDEKKKGITGTTYILFTVDVDGKITNVKVMNGIKDCEACDNEAVRVIKKMPNWIPAKKDGQNIKFNQMIPIKFHL